MKQFIRRAETQTGASWKGISESEYKFIQSEKQKILKNNLVDFYILIQPVR